MTCILSIASVSGTMLPLTINCMGNYNTEYYGVLANFVSLSKLNWHLLLTKGFVTVAILWKKENEAAVSLLIRLYATIL